MIKNILLLIILPIFLLAPLSCQLPEDPDPPDPKATGFSGGIQTEIVSDGYYIDSITGCARITNFGGSGYVFFGLSYGIFESCSVVYMPSDTGQYICVSITDDTRSMTTGETVYHEIRAAEPDDECEEDEREMLINIDELFRETD